MLKFVFLHFLNHQSLINILKSKYLGAAIRGEIPQSFNPRRLGFLSFGMTRFLGTMGGKKRRAGSSSQFTGSKWVGSPLLPPLPDPSDRVILNPDNHVFLIFNQTLIGCRDEGSPRLKGQ
jgi:hypothetical protein